MTWTEYPLMNVTTLEGFFSYPSVLYDWFFLGLLFTIFLILLGSTHEQDFIGSTFFSFIICMLIGLAFFTLGWLQAPYYLIFVVGGFIMSIFTGIKEGE